MRGDTIKVLYIAGSGRSGTTIIARLLGELQNFVNVGEAARYLFDGNMQARGVPCGCGSPVSECIFWKDIVRNIPLSAVTAGTRLIRMRHFPVLLAGGQYSRAATNYNPIVDAMGLVYRKIASTTGCEVVVDSSKNPANALLISLVSEIELHVLHVVRDPRNVVASWTTKKGYLATHRPGKVIGWWWSYNLLSEMLRIKARTYRRVRYEDFVCRPADVLQHVAHDLICRPVELPFLNGTDANIRTQHALAGNPDKLNTGHIKIHDTSSNSAGTSRLLIDLLTFPLQWRYRYLFPER